MRIIRDNIYLFSVARSCPGKIVACRTNDGDGAVGKNINDVIAFDKVDLDYAFSREGNEEYRSPQSLFYHFKYHIFLTI